MKKIIPFLLILLFALLFLVSYLPRIYNSHYGKTINNTAQAGLSISILIFFLFNWKKKIPSKPNNQDYN